jgi:hypothetical protein
MANISIFSDEWRECLRAHFTTVVRNQDKVTEKTLRGVMHEAGFSDVELRELTVRATMRIEDVDADFVPDLQVLEAEPVVVPGIAIAVPQEVIEAALVEESVALDEANAAEIEEAVTLDEATATAGEIEEAEMDEREIETETEGEDDPPPAAPDATQLSLF